MPLHESAAPAKFVELVREATRQFIDVDAATSADYRRFPGSVSGPDHGAMGVQQRQRRSCGRWLDRCLTDGQPCYASRRWTVRGSWGVGFMVDATTWLAHRDSQPVELHVWAWRDNPNRALRGSSRRGEVVGSAALRALELAQDLGEAHTTLATLHAFYDWNWPRAEVEFRKAIALAPKLAPARQWYGLSLCAMGRFSAGLKILRRALDLDPLSPMITIQLAVGYYLERRYADAIRICRGVLETDAQFWPAWLFLGQCHEQLGQFDDALSQLRSAAESSGRRRVAVSSRGHCCAHASDEPRGARPAVRTADSDRS